MKPMFNSIARFLLAGLSVYLGSKGLDSSTTDNVVALIANLLPGLAVGGVSLAWSAKDVQTRGGVVAPVIVPRETERPPKGYHLSDRSLGILQSVNPKLLELFTTAIIDSPFDFTCYHGLRTQAEQDEMLRTGASRVSHSKHQDGLAVDFFVWVNGECSWSDAEAYREVANHIKDCASRLNIPIVWGGDWKSFKDMVHIELK